MCVAFLGDVSRRHQKPQRSRNAILVGRKLAIGCAGVSALLGYLQAGKWPTGGAKLPLAPGAACSSSEQIGL